MKDKDENYSAKANDYRQPLSFEIAHRLSESCKDKMMCEADKSRELAELASWLTGNPVPQDIEDTLVGLLMGRYDR